MWDKTERQTRLARLGQLKQHSRLSASFFRQKWFIISTTNLKTSTTNAITFYLNITINYRLNESFICTPSNQHVPPQPKLKVCGSIFETPSLSCGISQMGQRRSLEDFEITAGCGYFAKRSKYHKQASSHQSGLAFAMHNSRPLVKYECKLTAH